MWQIWRRRSTTESDPKAPGPRGLAILALTLALIYLSIAWLQSDPKFSSAVQLTAALRYVLNEGAIDASPEAVFQAAATGLTSTLDPFSAYMPAEELSYFEEETQGEYVGIGVEIKITVGAIIIVRVLPHTSAAEAMLQPGDRIVSIDDTPTVGFTLLRAVELMRGPEGSAVSVVVQSPRGDERRLNLERRAVTVSPFPIHGVSRSGSGYIRWTDFTEGSADRLAAIVESMSIESPIGLILDLRGNPGGLLDEAVSAAGIFLPPDELVCRVIDRTGLEMDEYKTGESPASFSGPLVIVIDENSASASEVLAAALQETGRAIVVGRRSFGKGWVQNIFPFDDGSALRLSTARYYTPAGHTFGDPSVRLPNENTEVDSSWFAPSGLMPDSVVTGLNVGPWEETLAQNGVFADFAIANRENCPVDELLIRLRRWCDSLDISPEALGGGVADSEIGITSSQSVPNIRSEWEAIRISFNAAHATDLELLFERESPALVLCMWEQRMLTNEHPDEAELDEYFSVDRDLATARDILEQPVLLNDLLRRHPSDATASSSTSR